MKGEKMVCVASFKNRMEAELFQGILQQQGIESVLFADDADGMVPQLLMVTGGVRVFVQKEHETKAKKVVEEFRDS